jgi:hypothetical protein
VPEDKIACRAIYGRTEESFGIILWHVDPLLGNNREKSSYYNSYYGFSDEQVCMAAFEYSTRGTVFSVRSMPRSYKQDRGLVDAVNGVS